MAKVKIGFSLDTTTPETLPVNPAEMSVVGAIVTAPEKAAGIEFHTPYDVTTSDTAFYESLGAAGTAQTTLIALGRQLGEAERAARAVTVVVPEGATDDETIAAMVGEGPAFTGIHAFRKAAQTVGVAPRILVASGYTAQQADPGTANALTAELPAVADQLLAVAPVSGPGTTKQAAIDWRETLSSKRLIPTETGVTVSGPDGTPVDVASDAYIAGLMARVDAEHGGLPFHSAGNRPLAGVLRPSRVMEFSLTDGDTEAQQLLDAGLGVIVRGEYGDDFGIGDGGTVYLGVSTASADETWQFYNQVRGRDYLHLTALRTLRSYKARYNITNRTVQAYVNTLRSIVSGLAAGEYIHSEFKVELTPDLNSPQSLRDGTLAITLAVEEAAPFLRADIRSTRYEFALTEFVRDLESQINRVAV